MRTYSAELLDFLKDVEGCKLKAYADSGGMLTIGIGHLLTKSEMMSGKLRIEGSIVEWRNGVPYSKVIDLLKQDLVGVVTTVNSSVIVPLTQCQFDALVSFAFNVGNIAFIDSTLLKKLNAGMYDAVPDQLERWKYCNGKEVKGLLNRRRKEINLWKGEK